MSFQEGEYSSVFGTGQYEIYSGDYGYDPLGGPIFEDWFAAVLPSLVLNEQIFGTANPPPLISGVPEIVPPTVVPVVGYDEPAPVELPTVGNGSVGAGGSDSDNEDAVTWEDLPEWVREPIYAPETPAPTEFPNIGGGIAHPYPTDETGDEMATTWLDVFDTVAEGYFGSGQSFVPAVQPGVTGIPPEGYPSSAPARVTVDTRTGKVTPCRRRRRRRLLTCSDIADLQALAAIAGKGQALNIAVAKACRR